jgi:hypothetical protein
MANGDWPYYYGNATAAPSMNTTYTVAQPAWTWMPPHTENLNPVAGPEYGWPCPNCTLVMAPWVSHHRCTEAGGMLYKDTGEPAELDGDGDDTEG